jgi:hypothetical protein
MSEVGQKRRFDPLPTTSGLPPLATELRTSRLGSFVPHPESCSAAFRRLGGAAAGPAKSSEFLEVERANSQSDE